MINKKIKFNYTIIKKYSAGIILRGAEVKSVRKSEANISDAHCVIIDNEVYIKNMHISHYKNSSFNDFEQTRTRKLLLTKKEISDISTYLFFDKSITLIPTAVINKRTVKIDIVIAKGKKLFEKRQDIKKRDLEREMKII